MFSLDDIFAINRKFCEQLSEPFDNSPAVTCTRTFTLLPLRYAVVGGNHGQRQQLPELPAHLHHPHQVGELQHASYAIRTLREGFLYVLEKRKTTGRYTWHPPYRIAANGLLSLTEPGLPHAPPPPAFSAQDAGRQIAWAFNVHDLDDLHELRLFYSPDPLTLAAQQQLLRRRDSLPALDIRKYAAPSCAVPAPHVLTHDQLDTVVDFAAESDPALRKLLDAQLFGGPQVISRVASQQMLQPAAGKANPRGIAIVVEDAIGITQELNAWRNAGLEQLKDWLENTPAPDAKGNPGPSNERKVLVAQAFTELHRNFSERKVAAHVRKRTQAIRERLDESNNTMTARLDPQRWQDTKEQILEATSELHRRDLEARAQTGEFSRLFDERYLPRVDLAAMQQQLAWFEIESNKAQAAAEARAADHLSWLQHPRLQDALALYDPDDLINGLCFAHQTGLCVIGMEGVPAGADLLSRWWRADSVTPDNLALRSFTYNQRSIAEALEQTRTQLKYQPLEGDDLKQFESALKLSKALAALFSQVDGQLDLIARHGHINAAGALAWLGQLGREAARAGAPNSLDRAMHRRLASYLTASLGEQAVALRLAELAQAGQAPSSGRVSAPILRRLDSAYATSLQNAHSNSFYRLRVASGLLLLEASLLLLQGRRDDKDRRFWSEVAAAGLTSVAAGLELLAVGTGQALANVGPNSATARGAQISLGRYRLWGAGMAAAGGLVSIGWDLKDGVNAFAKSDDLSNSRQSTIGAAYTIRATATLALLSGQGGIAFSQAGAYFRWLALKGGRFIPGVLLDVLSRWATRLAVNQTAILLLGRMAWGGGLIVLTATIVLLILDESALEKWCDKCCFSRNRETNRYNSAEDELSAFFDAIEGTL
ncbi:T6SS effector BTH_I2691 family protein [Pseudomonas sp. JUb96]|uniref:T6SS effector BTH_I2691 family protein n=1 Tax=Pseudomonas sp. JUb96 TaxID=2940539 RepID=UPI002226305D|nr:T6SS effector BTH_I2691 family protein [Pseudomonas sp. JUb96]MCW2270625.1 hypothetical protein [Pseudomonas sp. JUb96]